MKLIKTLLIITTLTTLSASSLSANDPMAWMYEDQSSTEAKQEKLPKHNCPVPIKLKVLNDNRDVHRINEANRRFNNCINDFIHEQEKEIKNTNDIRTKNLHVKAINKAIADAKRYKKGKVEENQKYGGHSSKFDGLGFESDRDQEKEKLDKMK